MDAQLDQSIDRQVVEAGLAHLANVVRVDSVDAKLKQLVADLDKTILQEAKKREVVRPAQRRTVAVWAREAYALSVRRACTSGLRSSTSEESCRFSRLGCILPLHCSRR